MQNPRHWPPSAIVVLALALAALVWTAPVQSAPLPQDAPQSAKAVDVNRATAAELEAVPGIGPVLAKRIVEFREKHGPFERLEDLLKVRGIGEKSLERLRPHLTVGKPRA